MPPALCVHDLAFGYAGERPLLELARFQLDQGRSALVLGPSGSGKTTLLHLIAGLLRPQHGEIAVAGQALGLLRGSALDRFRGRSIGLVFQRLHLLPALSVLDNLLLAQRLAGARADAARARELLAALGIEALADLRPTRISQGQAQRAAIARALVHQPPLILADEPTSSLDDGNAERAIDLLQRRAQAIGASLIVVTHDRRLRDRFDRELLLEPHS